MILVIDGRVAGQVPAARVGDFLRGPHLARVPDGTHAGAGYEGPCAPPLHGALLLLGRRGVLRAGVPGQRPH
eukprot:1176947-Prorocentrum_minimum.AAC.1